MPEKFIKALKIRLISFSTNFGHRSSVPKNKGYLASGSIADNQITLNHRIYENYIPFIFDSHSGLKPSAKCPISS
jgi:hypothetical protein